MRGGVVWQSDASGSRQQWYHAELLVTVAQANYALNTIRKQKRDDVRGLLGVGKRIINTRRYCSTLRISRGGHGVYVCSPTELQKFTVSAELVSQVSDVLGAFSVGNTKEHKMHLGNLYMNIEMPEPPRQNIFGAMKSLLSGSSAALDREELCLVVLSLHLCQRSSLQSARHREKVRDMLHATFQDHHHSIQRAPPVVPLFPRWPKRAWLVDFFDAFDTYINNAFTDARRAR